MAIEISAATVAAIAKVVTPITQDIYETSKGSVKKALKRWEEKSFPKRLAKKIESLSLVKTLWIPGKNVSLLTFYHPPTIRAIDSGKAKVANCIADVGSGNSVIQGIVGQGKSIFLRWLAIQEAQSSSSARLPVFIELRTLHDGYTLRNAIFKVLESFDISINDETFEHLAATGKLILLLDAFDELNEDLVRETLNEISYLSRRFERMQIIVTSRPGNEIQKVSGFKVITISPLKSTEYKIFLDKMGLNEDRNNEIVNAIKNSRGGLANLITTPLMLTLVVIVYESEREIPATMPEFFEVLFKIVLTRHDRLKDGFSRKRNSGLSDGKLQELFEAFCFMVIRNGYGRSLTGEQFTKTFKNAIEYSVGCRCDQDKFQADIVKGACLMLEEGVDSITFLHKSLMEYYAAAFIRHSTDEVAEMFYQQPSINEKAWREVLNFLANIDSYRFSKNFAMPQIKMVREKYISAYKKKNSNDLIKILRGRESKSYFVYLTDFEKDKRTFHPGYYSSDIDVVYYSGILWEKLIHTILVSMPQSVSESEIEKILDKKISFNKEMDEVKIPSDRLVQYIGAEAFWKIIGIYETWLDEQEGISVSVIANHDKRKKIFEI